MEWNYQMVSVPKSLFEQNLRVTDVLKFVWVKIGTKTQCLCKIIPTTQPTIFASCDVIKVPKCDSNKERIYGVSTILEDLEKNRITFNAFDVQSSKVVGQERIAKRIKVIAIRNHVEEDVSEMQIRRILSLFRVQEQTLVSLVNHPSLSNKSNIHSVLILNVDPAEETSSSEDEVVFETRTDTVIEIEKLICKERLDFLVKNNSREDLVFGLRPQRDRLAKIMKNPSLGFRGVLISGPSGCGKRSLVQQTCADEGIHLISVYCSSLLDSNPGQTEQNIKAKVESAEKHSSEGPTALAFVGLEMICPHRESAKPHQLTLMTFFLGLLDRLHDKRSKLIVVCVTNRPQDIDLSLRQPSRLRTEVAVGIPNSKERKEIIRNLCQSLTFRDGITLDYITERTPGFVGSDLRLLTTRLSSLLRDHQTMDVSRTILEAALHEVSPSAFKSGLGIVEVNRISWDDIGGLLDVKMAMRRAIEWPLKHPDAFARLGIRSSKGCLLYGPPGCGKTKLARACASSCGVVFLAASAASIFSPYVGDSERAISELFRRARMASPSILFIDEIDALVSTRDGKASGVQEKVLATLLNEMDGIGVQADELGSRNEYEQQMQTREVSKIRNQSSSVGDVIVVCATNRPHVLDPALLRPGRLDQLVFVPPPDKDSRVSILEHFTRKMDLSGDVDLDALADRLDLYSGADLENLCREAFMEAVTDRGFDVDVIRQEDFERAIAKSGPSISKEMIERFRT